MKLSAIPFKGQETNFKKICMLCFVKKKIKKSIYPEVTQFERKNRIYMIARKRAAGYSGFKFFILFILPIYRSCLSCPLSDKHSPGFQIALRLFILTADFCAFCLLKKSEP